MTFRHFIPFLIILSLMIGCRKPHTNTAQLGVSTQRRVVILGEGQTNAAATYYRKKYGAMVWFTPKKGAFADAMSRTLRATAGPSPAMYKLINELESISRSFGEWAIIVPERGERYFLVTLRNMEDGAIHHTHGSVLLVDSYYHEAIEREVYRVMGDQFQVVYKDEI